MDRKWKNYLSVMFFAFFGGAVRAWLNSLWSFTGTMVVNVVGCFLLAFLTYFFINYREGRDWLATGLSTGFVGAFTTFSTFQLETLKQIQSGKISDSLIYFFVSLIVGLIFAFLGMLVGNKVGEKLGDKA
ncbi:CrcB family protein [uncultured Lactobacillus sp.]|uniref:fluoride efflux transporter FluC n=1 Tax=uncultured Lactobacillus sp. TaxID=153152 RepID=UPI00260888AF|nr:CrcB family protein [uncultured Lactobacillus sp.]